MGYGKVAVHSRKPAISQKQGKAEQELLLIAYYKVIHELSIAG